MSVPENRILGSYRLIERIGKGGMGEVYRAEHLKLGREAAVKVLPSNLVNEADFLKRFEREASSAACCAVSSACWVSSCACWASRAASCCAGAPAATACSRAAVSCCWPAVSWAWPASSCACPASICSFPAWSRARPSATTGVCGPSSR